MKKLFTGKFGRIPAAVLATVLISVLVAGGVVAATGGYTLWTGSIAVTVVEPIHIYFASEAEHTADPSSYPHELVLGSADPLTAAVTATPGVCVNTYFKIINSAPSGLLIKAVTSSTNSSVVTVAFSVATLTTTGVVVDVATPLLVARTVCVNGTAPSGGVYTASTEFTRESPPAP